MYTATLRCARPGCAATVTGTSDRTRVGAMAKAKLIAIQDGWVSVTHYPLCFEHRLEVGNSW